MQIRNIAVIAHVDHGKTTLVDAMLKQTHTFRDNQKEMHQELIMDSNDLEREKGITILAKNTSVYYHENKINIIDTPGHADFGGEVERVLNMASGAILLVDAAEGPLPQTKFVLKKALDAKLKIILIINKIDKKDARIQEVQHEVESLFLDLAEDEDALHFPILYAVGRDGKVFNSIPDNYTSDIEGSIEPLFQTIVDTVPNSAINQDQPFQLLISTLDSDSYVGRLCIGKVNQGTLTKGDRISLVENGVVKSNHTIMKLFTSVGLERQEVDEVTSGDIVALAGIPELTIGQTVTDPEFPISLPAIQVDDPTIKITVGPVTSPFAGREGKFTTSRQIKERLWKEKQTNLGLRIEEDEASSNFTVSGRGELHLAVLIETMRREGFEMDISRPQVIYKEIDGKTSEPFEEVTIDVAQEYTGAVSEEFGRRRGTLSHMFPLRNDVTRLVYKISSQNLIGIRGTLMTKTRGTVVMSSFLLGYEPKGLPLDQTRNGALIAAMAGTSMTYGLINAQERGTLFIDPGVKVYEGMVVGLSSREDDIEVNVCKEKKLTNHRSKGEGVKDALEPSTVLSLEQCLDFIAEDELLEVTPVALRLRKRYLTQIDRVRFKRSGKTN